MRPCVLSILMVFTSLSLADPIRQESIHVDQSVFTANEFRDYLKTLRFKQSMDKLSQTQLSKEQQKKLADFAERLLKQSKEPGEKKDLEIPDELLKNPAIKKMLEDEKFLEKLLDNKPLLDLAERIAKRYNLPNSPLNEMNPPPIPTPSAPTDRMPNNQGMSRRADSASQGSREDHDSPGQPSESDKAQPDKARAKKGAFGSAKEGSANPAVPFDRNKIDPRASAQRGNSSRGAAEQATNGPRNGKVGPSDDGPGMRMLRQLTENAQRAGVLKGSRALEQFEQRLQANAGERGYVEPPVDYPNPPEWLKSTAPPELPTTTSVDQWLERVGKISLDDMKLPPGLAEWAPSLGRIPMPRLPNIGGSFAAPPIPRMPAFALSPPTARGSGAFVALLAGVASVFLIGMLLRSRMEPLLKARREKAMGTISVYRPNAPLDTTDRASIRDWFEYLALVCLGEPARSRNHVSIAESLRAKSSPEAHTAADLADLYEQARYLPPGESIEARPSK